MLVDDDRALQGLDAALGAEQQIGGGYTVVDEWTPSPLQQKARSVRFRRPNECIGKWKFRRNVRQPCAARLLDGADHSRAHLLRELLSLSSRRHAGGSVKEYRLPHGYRELRALFREPEHPFAIGDGQQETEMRR